MTTTTITEPDDGATLPAVGDTLRLTDGTTARVLGSYDPITSRSLIGQDHAWQVTGPIGARVIGLADIAAPRPEVRCPECAGLNGSHGYVHVRHEQGGGGWNRPCSWAATPETEDDQITGASRVPVELPGADHDHATALVINAAIELHRAAVEAHRDYVHTEPGGELAGTDEIANTISAAKVEAEDALYTAVRAYLSLVTS